ETPVASERRHTVSRLAASLQRGVRAVGAHLGHGKLLELEASVGERIAHQVLDRDDEPGGEDRNRALYSERPGFGRRRRQVLGETAEHGIDLECRADSAEQRIEGSLTAAN